MRETVHKPIQVCWAEQVKHEYHIDRHGCGLQYLLLVIRTVVVFLICDLRIQNQH